MAKQQPLLVTEEQARDIEQVIRWVRGFRCDGLVKTPDGMTILFDHAIPRHSAPRSDDWRLLDLTGNRTCGGTYSAFVVALSSDEFNTGSATFDDSDIGTNGADEVTVINLNERGQTTHALTAGTPIAHQFWGRLAPFVDDAGRSVYLVNAFNTKECS